MNNKNSTLLVIFIIFSVILFFCIRSKNLEEKIINNHSVVCGNILSMRSGKGTNVIFEFTLNGKKIESNISSPTTTFENYKKGIFKILVVVENSNPSNNAILADYGDYEKYNITTKDTANLICY